MARLLHWLKASHISQLMNTIRALLLLQHSCISISEIKCHTHALPLVSKLVWSVAVHELELQSNLADDLTIPTLGKCSLYELLEWTTGMEYTGIPFDLKYLAT